MCTYIMSLNFRDHREYRKIQQVRVPSENLWIFDPGIF